MITSLKNIVTCLVVLNILSFALAQDADMMDADTVDAMTGNPAQVAAGNAPTPNSTKAPDSTTPVDNNGNMNSSGNTDKQKADPNMPAKADKMSVTSPAQQAQTSRTSN